MVSGTILYFRSNRKTITSAGWPGEEASSFNGSSETTCSSSRGPYGKQHLFERRIGVRNQSTPAERVRWILRHLCGRMSALLSALSLGLFFLGIPPSNLVAAIPDDAFVAGYATAVLEREFNVRAPSLHVREGLITVTAEDLAGANREEVLRRLSSIRGVLRVVVLSADPASPDPASTIALQPPAADRGPGKIGPTSDPLPVGWLPEGHLFRPTPRRSPVAPFFCQLPVLPERQERQKRWRSQLRGNHPPVQDGRADRGTGGAWPPGGGICDF